MAVFISIFCAACGVSTQPANPSTISGVPQAPTEVTTACIVKDSKLDEISGIAASIAHPGILWVHNDSGDEGRIFALDAQTCAVKAAITVDGFDPIDMEAIAMGRDATGGWQIWLGDIGDNLGEHNHVTLARIPEPTTIESTTVAAKSFDVTYSNGPRNAEALLVDPKVGGTVWIVTKVESDNGQFYEVPIPSGSQTTAKPVGSAPVWVSDAAFSPNGDQFVMRTIFDGQRRMGTPPGSDETSLRIGFHGQGEAITYSADGRFLYFISEGKNAPLKMAPLP